VLEVYGRGAIRADKQGNGFVEPTVEGEWTLVNQEYILNPYCLPILCLSRQQMLEKWLLPVLIKDAILFAIQTNAEKSRIHLVLQKIGVLGVTNKLLPALGPLIALSRG